MYKSIHGMAPAYLCNEITLHSEIAERTTRSVNDNNVFVPYAHHMGPIMWNSLPDYIKTCVTLQSYKAKMKLYIIIDVHDFKLSFFNYMYIYCI